MRKCTGNNTQEWGADAIFDVKCKGCGNLIEFFKDEITRNCSRCKNTVYNDRKDYGCNQWCSSSSSHKLVSSRVGPSQRYVFIEKMS